jgi:hypothetical protein
MDAQAFRRILTTFADSPANLDLGRGTLMVQIREDIVEAKLFTRHGSLCVQESGDEMPAPQWLIQRVARLPLLADRILTYLPAEPHFVTPGGDLLDQLDEAPLDEQTPVQDASQRMLEVLGRRPGGTASVVYLTSDAGEGKTTLITHMARVQAQGYKDKKQDWLLVPVSLGGRTFMRFDDVIVGALVNRLRFPFLYYDAFIELVKLGVVVPAFDGFEEMFVEGSAGDAISALGNLVNTMQSSGAVLIAARKAYFEYKNLHSQTRLFDSLGGQSVSFARLALRRWDKPKFLQYARNRGVPNGEQIYQEVSDKLSADHPLLTRAVLVKRLLDVATAADDRTRLLANIETDPNDYFRQFVGSIIGREAREKWIDKKGEVAQPLISEDDHYELLANVALEMWSSSTESLRPDLLDFVGELFADSKRKDKVVTYQIIERLKQHALIVQTEGNKFGFDHQEFYHFFLGEAIGRLLVVGDKPMISHAFRQGAIPALATEAAAKHVKRAGTSVTAVVNTVNELCLGEPRASFIKDNLGGIVIRLLDYDGSSGVTVMHGSFPPESLAGRNLTGVEFRDCYFQSTPLGQARLVRCRFVGCEFESLELTLGAQIEETILDGCNCRSAIPPNSETAVFAPQQVEEALRLAGFTFAAAVERPPVAPPDENMVLVVRMLRAFMRSTGVNENTLIKRLGAQGPQFFRDVLPRLESAHIVQDVKFKGHGNQRRFRLNLPLQRLEGAVEQCGGNFDRFIEMASGGE